MSGWIMWVVAACVLGVGEVLTRRFLLAPLALGAVLAAVVEVAGPGGAASWIVFAAISLLVLFAVRPIARSRIQTQASIRTSKAALIGRNAIVLEAIANSEGAGCVKIGGEVWTARALDDDRVIERGTRVEVVEIKGATALVTATDAAGPE
jgi:membrane protein implicated in regulation of membrane protease activity